MGIKIFLLLLFSPHLFAQDEISIGTEKIYALKNQVMLYRANGLPIRMRTDQRSTRSIAPQDRVSEIFAETPEGGGRVRALPGGIIVNLEKDVDSHVWAQENELEVIRKIAKDTYLIKSSVGRKTLSELEQVKILPQVISAQPNWWSPVEARGRIPASGGLIRGHEKLLSR